MMTAPYLSWTGPTGPSQPLTGDYDLLFVYFSSEFSVCVS